MLTRDQLNALTFQFILANGKKLNVDKGKFDGDIDFAISFIQDFCNKNTVAYTGFRGYGTLQVNDTKHPINPYGIDLDMMIGFCGGNSLDFKKIQTSASNNLSNNSLFKEHNETHVVQRGTDILITVDVENAANITANEIISKATSTNSKLPAYKPDGCGAILLFHTPNNEIYGLGGLRDNPALKDLLNTEGTPFQPQVNTTIGGRLFDSEIPLRESIMNAIKYKMFFDADIAENSPAHEAQQVIKSLIVAIEASEGWNNDVCVHTDRWENNDKSIGTMCFLTGIKHINCTDDELKKIEEALRVMMDYKQSQGEQPRNLSNFKFYPFINTMKNATAEYLITRTELEKAEKAHQNKVFVTFNDLCLETFRVNGTYTKMGNGSSELSLPATTSAVNNLHI